MRRLKRSRRLETKVVKNDETLFSASEAARFRSLTMRLAMVASDIPVLVFVRLMVCRANGKGHGSFVEPIKTMCAAHSWTHSV